MTLHPLLAIDWTPIVVALIAGLPGIIAAIAAVRVKREIRTSDGLPIGPMVEETHDLAKAAKEHSEQVVTALEKRRRGPQVPE